MNPTWAPWLLGGLLIASTGRASEPSRPASHAPLASRVPLPLEPLRAMPEPPDNEITGDKAELGKLLFFDPRLSGDGSTSCASCHDPKIGWGTGSDLSRGYPGTQHWRNSQTILNSAFYARLFWAGEATSLESQADAAITGALAGNGEPEMIEERLAQIPEYVRRFQRVFGTQRPLYPDVLRAIATFERVGPISRNAPFDQYAWDHQALSESAIRGLALFEGKAGCIRCHDGHLLSDESYHALGVPENPAFGEDPMRQVALRFQHYTRGVPEKSVYRVASRDLGLYYVTKRPEDMGRFRTPSLREVTRTAPYMHNGVFVTLEEVIDFYDQGGGDDPRKDSLLAPLHLTAEEKRDLISFLGSLSGDEIIIAPPPLPPYVATERMVTK